jgi:hypothetical protein
MAISDLAIAQAIATKAALMTVGATYAPIRGATATPSENLPTLPYAFVLPGPDSVSYGSGGGNRLITLRFTVRLFLGSQTDYARRFAALHAYRTAMRDFLVTSVTLGGLVDSATVSGTDIGTDSYGGDDFVTVEASVEVTKLDPVNSVA